MRLRQALAIAVTVVAGVAVIGFFTHRSRRHTASAFVAPNYVEPAPGPRAPRVDFLGAHFGASRRVDVERGLASWGVACRDRSVRALMNELREHKREELARAGEADVVSGASIVSRRTARDDNPQVRLGCERVTSRALRDRARPLSVGRVLFVFDAHDSVVRHASFQRNHPGWEDAHADFRSARDALAAVLGPAQEPPSRAGSTAGSTAVDAPPKYGRRVVEWRFADLVATVSMVNLANRGFSISESVEVPLPVRADAPSRRSAPVARGGFRASDDSR